MPRFDNLATAAMTPGGFQAGVNDLVQALMQKPIQEQRMAQAGEEQMWNRSFKERSLGAQMSNDLATQQLRGREIESMDRRAAGGERGPKQLDERGAFDLSLRQANLEVFGNPDGMAYQEMPDNAVVTDLMGKPQIVQRGVKRSERDATPEEKSRVRAMVEEARTAKTTSSAPVAQVGINVQTPRGDTDGLSYREPDSRGMPRMSAGAPQGLGSQMAASMGSAPPALDYAAMDAKLQASDPEYRQMRANPRFNWKRALDEMSTIPGR